MQLILVSLGPWRGNRSRFLTFAGACLDDIYADLTGLTIPSAGS